MQGITGVDDKRRLIFSLVPKNYYLANSCNYILPKNKNEAKYLLGLLNSTLLNWIFKKNSTNSNVNCYEINSLPVINPTPLQQEKIISIIDTILSKNNIDNNLVADFDRQIDLIVYKTYNLTYDEVKIIDLDFPFSEQEYEKI